MYEILNEKSQKIEREHQYATSWVLLETAPSSPNSVQTKNTPKELSYPYGGTGR